MWAVDSFSLTDFQMQFSIVGDIHTVETIATGYGVRIRCYLNRAYGRGRWRKMKGIAAVRFSDGTFHEAELHWFKAHGIGRRDFKIKRFIP